MSECEHLAESVALTIEDAKEHGLSLVAVNVKLLEATIEKLNELAALKRKNESLRKLAYDYIQAYEKLAFADALLTTEEPE